MPPENPQQVVKQIHTNRRLTTDPQHLDIVALLVVQQVHKIIEVVEFVLIRKLRKVNVTLDD